ncbi:hypothetical protein LXL04_015208 [Taraxacum kok-saghyz]
MMKKRGEESTKLNVWSPYPVTRYHKPEGHGNQIDPAELRELLLKHKPRETENFIDLNIGMDYDDRFTVVELHKRHNVQRIHAAYCGGVVWEEINVMATWTQKFSFCVRFCYSPKCLRVGERFKNRGECALVRINGVVVRLGYADDTDVDIEVAAVVVAVDDLSFDQVDVGVGGAVF